ncbi:MAG: hypothetical protein L0K41_07155, partial [Yaniella sp.]|nr:hypothetical protein [Yaniella sp.]
VMEGSVAATVGSAGSGRQQSVAIEHPTGMFEALVDLNDDGAVVASGNTRTARLISRGELYVPREIWDPGHESTGLNHSV